MAAGLDPNTVEALRLWFEGEYGIIDNAWQSKMFDVAQAAVAANMRHMSITSSKDAVMGVSTQLASNDHSPYVVLTWGGLVARLDPGAARDHAAKILEAAGAAEMDAVFWRWMIKNVGVGEEDAAKALLTFRDGREALAPDPAKVLAEVSEVLRDPSIPEAIRVDTIRQITRGGMADGGS
jgi:hypothetical protein